MFEWIGLGGEDETEIDEVKRLQARIHELSNNVKTGQPHQAVIAPPGPQQPPHHMSGQLAVSPIPSDARQVIEVLRTDLGSQRKMLEDFYHKMEPMILQLTTMTESFDKIKHESNPTHLKAHFVSSARFAEAIADLKLELNACKVAQTPRAEVEQFAAQAVANSMQGMIQSQGRQHGGANAGFGRDEFNERLIELRQEIARGYVRKDEFLAAISAAKDQSTNDVSLLQNALESSAAKVGSLRKADMHSASTPSLENSPNPMYQPRLSPRLEITSRKSPRRDDGEVQIVLNRREGSKLGLSLDGSDGKALAIERITPEGDIPSWNAANPSDRLKPGDRIVAINDVRGDSGMLIDEMASSSNSKTVLMVARQAEFRKVIHLDEVQPQMKNNHIFVRLPANRDEKLGMSLKCDEEDVLKIVKIVPGCMKRWNENNARMAVRTGDQLISANGKSGSPTTMLEELKDGGEINLVFLRIE